jgi:predicted Zn-dependent protease
LTRRGGLLTFQIQARNLSRLLKRIIFLLAGALAAIGPWGFAPVHAQQKISFVRDAEVETTIRAFATPLFVAAGLDPHAIRVHLVNDPSLNAFVANGLNMFINTGLLIRADDAGQVIGVMAHETGHITGGHLARLRDGMANATTEAIMAMVLGAAAAVAGRPDAGAAIIMGGTHAAERGLLRYSREMERSADQAGVNLLDRTQQSAKGMMEFLDILADQELLSVGRQDPYVRTHPISRERVEFVRNFLASSRYTDTPINPEFAEKHRRMRAKLQGFIDPNRALQTYKETDTSVEARYARAIAYSRRPDYAKALPLMDQLIAERPNDGYFYEVKAQMVFESGKPKEARPLYQRAVDLLPDDALIRIDLARVQLEDDSPDAMRAAIANLETARRVENDNTELWRLLAVAYGRDGQTGMAALAQAERALQQRRLPEARAFAERAERSLPAGSAGSLRAQDIRRAAEKPKD